MSRAKEITWNIRCVVCWLFALLTAGCSSFHAGPYSPADFSGAITRTNIEATVTACALTVDEAKECFGLNLIGKGIQPVWLRIRNDGDTAFWFLPSGTDPFYYSAAEIEHMYATPLSSGYNTARLGFLTQMMIDDFIPPHAVREGFIYTRRRDGMWRGNVLLISENSVRRLSFLFPGERLRTDHQQLEFERYYADSMASTNLQESRLQAALSALPCYATDASGRKTGDPLNFIVIGNQQHLFSALIGAEWDETERLDIKSAWRTCWSFVSGTGYRTSPISPLYVFGRRQDTSFQKIRKSVHSRIHLRLWLTSLRYQDTPVWIGQVSRDIGVKLTPRTPNLTTHMIDPDVDADRWYLVQELLRGQAVDQLGLVDGCASHTPETPGRNLTEDNFFTDGLRVVLFLSKEPTAMDEVHLLDWAKPPESLVPVTYPSTD